MVEPDENEGSETTEVFRRRLEPNPTNTCESCHENACENVITTGEKERKRES